MQLGNLLPGARRWVRDAHDPAGHDAFLHRVGAMRQYQAQSGRVLATVGHGQPFKVILTFGDGSTTEHPCDSARDGHEFIRRCVAPTGAAAARLRG